MRVLIVDDDEVDRERLKRILLSSRSHSEIVEARTVEEGIEAYNQNHFDIVLLDYRMPKRDGIEMLKELRSLPRDGSVAIVMMSTSEDEKLALECLNAGAQDFVPKAEINKVRLMRAIAHSHIRFKLEKELWASYKQVKVLAERDSLTGLANRYLFDETLRMAIVANERHAHKVALILFDLDNFKFVNDTYGHDVGDLLLKRTVQRIKSCLRGNELFCRLGGDEFSITIAGVSDLKAVSAIANRIKSIFLKPYVLNGQNVRSSVSFGISIHPDNASDASEIYKQADIALYRAKQHGKNRICFFEEEMQRQFSERFIIEQELIESSFSKDMFLLYQPIYLNADKSIIGAEALLRWRFNSEVRSPDSFISVAEDSHLINEIGRWVIDEAFLQLSIWKEDLSPSFGMSINLSPKELLEDDLVDFISDALLKYDLRAESIQFELTETVFMGTASQTILNIQKLSQMGCSIALDDFGTGFSSISHLHNFPINTVKIDKSILPVDGGCGKTEALFEGLCSMLQALDLSIVVEGVEQKNQVDLCAKLRADKLQGYYFSKPVTPDKLASLFNEKELLF